MATLEERLDPQIAPVLPDLASFEFTETAAHPAVQRRDIIIPGLENAADIPLRLYQPLDRSTVALPVMLWIHGGGFVGGSHQEFPELLEGYVLETGAVVVSVGYRLAPEHPFPAGFNDCYAALMWLASASHELNIDPAQIVIGGGSAGACLATAVALKARDVSGPKISFQYLLVPVTDDRMATPSSQAITDPRIFNSAALRSCWAAYLGEAEGEVSPYAAPARAEDLSGMPPAYIYVEDQDPMRDEGIAYANRLMQAGVSTELHVLPGTFHGSFLIASDAEVCKRAISEQMATLRRVLKPAQ